MRTQGARGCGAFWFALWVLYVLCVLAVLRPPPALLAKSPGLLRPELASQHPRLFFTADELPGLRARLRGDYADRWVGAFAASRIFGETSGQPRSVLADGLESASLAYALTGSSAYAEPALRWLAATLGQAAWVSAPGLEGVRLLAAAATAYDILFDYLSADLRRRTRDRLAAEGRQLYVRYAPAAGKRFPFDSDQFYTPVAALGLTALALHGEITEAGQWAELSRNWVRNTLTILGSGEHLPGPFAAVDASLSLLARYTDAWERTTGESLFDLGPWRRLPAYYAYQLLPGGRGVLDGPPGSPLAPANYGVLYLLAQRFRDASAQGIGDWWAARLPPKGPLWHLIWRDPELSPASLEALPRWALFPTSGAVLWRSGWRQDDAAVALRAGFGLAEPLALARRLPLWFPPWERPAPAVYPAAGSLFWFARGAALIGDPAGSSASPAGGDGPLVDGVGPWSAARLFARAAGSKGVAPRIAAEWHSPAYAYARAEAEAAYDPGLGLERLWRHVLWIDEAYLLVWDEFQANQPHVFASIFRSPASITPDGEGGFMLESGGVQAGVRPVFPLNRRTEAVPGGRLSVSTTVAARQGNILTLIHIADSPQEIPEVAPIGAPDAARGFGVSLRWPQGAREAVLFDSLGRGIDWQVNGASELRSDGARIGVRWGSDGRWERLIIDGGTSVWSGGETLLAAASRVTAAIEVSANRLHGTLDLALPGRFDVQVGGALLEVTLDENPIPFEYEPGMRRLRVEVPSGRHTLTAVWAEACASPCAQNARS